MDENITYEGNRERVRQLFTTTEVKDALNKFLQVHAQLRRLWLFDSKHLLPGLGPMFASDNGKGLAALILRTNTNIESLLSFDQVKHFQAIAMLTRTILELAIDIRLSGTFDDFSDRLLWFSRLEHLRVCRRLKQIASDSQALDMPEVMAMVRSMNANESEVLTRAKCLWPKSKSPFNVKHWSGMNLDRRASEAGEPFNIIYFSAHIQLSWLNHGGTAGITELTPYRLAMDCVSNFSRVIEMYRTVLETSIAVSKPAESRKAFEAELLTLCTAEES